MATTIDCLYQVVGIKERNQVRLLSKINIHTNNTQQSTTLPMNNDNRVMIGHDNYNRHNNKVQQQQRG